MIIIENPLKIKYKFVVFEVNSKTIEEFETMAKARFLRTSKVEKIQKMIVGANHFDSPIIINDVGKKKRIIDGQHRIASIRGILEKNPEFMIQILLVVYSGLDKDQEKEIFTRWNSGTRQSGDDILQIYTDEIPIYDMIQDITSIYLEKGKVKFRNMIQPYLMAQDENPMQVMNPMDFIEKAKRLNEKDAEKIREFIKEFVKHTKGIHTFSKATIIDQILGRKKEKKQEKEFNPIRGK